MHGKGHLRPAEIGKLTMPELILWLDVPQEGENRPPPHSAAGRTGVLKYIEWLNSLTPQQYLDACINDEL